MKLLLISADFPPVNSGEASHAYSLALNLARRGVDVHVLTSAIRNVVSHPSFKVYPVMRNWSWFALPRFVSFLKRCSPEGVLLMFMGLMYKHHPMITFAPTIAKATGSCTRFVTQFENIGVYVSRLPVWTRLGRKVFSQLVVGPGASYEYGSLLCHSDRVIVLSDTHKMELANHYAELHKTCVLIPPAATITICQGDDETLKARGRAALGVKDDEFLIVYYGYIYRGKGLETLIRAFQTVHSCHSKARLVVVGGANPHVGGELYDQEIHNLTALAGIADKVTFTGPCPPDREQGSLYLRAADLCALPFDRGIHLNNSSFAVAAVHGLPVVTTRGVEQDAPFLHGENVFLCPPEDPDALANAIHLLIERDDLRFRLRRGIQAMAREWFSWERATDRIIETFGRIVEPAPLIVEGEVDNVL